MSPVIVVFVVWFAIVLILGGAAIAYAPRVHAPAWGQRVAARFIGVVDGARGAASRITVGVIVALAAWSAVIIIGWILGLWAHRLQGSIDEPTFHWWQDRYLTGSWHTVWWKLTNVGSPTVTQILALIGAAVFGVLYWGRRSWWAPSATILFGYLAEKYSQMLLKAVVHRGHPPTTLGTWPSGGMGRLIDIYGLIIFFMIMRFWKHSPRMWALGATVLAVCASIQAYARINNLEHWLTDVIGGALYGLTLLLMMIATYFALTHERAADGGDVTTRQDDRDLVTERA